MAEGNLRPSPLRSGDILVVWRLDCLGQSLAHLVETVDGLAARGWGSTGGRKFALTKAQVRLVHAAMASRGTFASDLAAELGIRSVTLYC